MHKHRFVLWDSKAAFDSEEFPNRINIACLHCPESKIYYDLEKLSYEQVVTSPMQELKQKRSDNFSRILNKFRGR